MPLREVRVENRAFPAALPPPCALPCSSAPCVRQLRIVMNLVVLVVGMVVLYWTFGRPMFSPGRATAEVPAQAGDTAGSTASPVLSARAYAMWRVLAQSWG